ncbi:MAG: hypothetical protein RL015_2602 [Verrucomicrobiota bacterium]|jgi:hypothetical protein
MTFEPVEKQTGFLRAASVESGAAFLCFSDQAGSILRYIMPILFPPCC